MSKAFLLIDMPEKCDDCPYADLIMGECDAFSVLREGYTYELPEEGEPRPEYCPLKTLPERKIIHDGFEIRRMGYNDCLDDIVGEE